MTNSSLDQAQQAFDALAPYLSPGVVASIAQRLERFARVSRPKLKKPTSDAVLLARPGLPPRPFTSPYFVVKDV